VREFLEGRARVTLDVPKGKAPCLARETTNRARQPPQSTNVSSPVRAPLKNRGKELAGPDDETGDNGYYGSRKPFTAHEDSDDAFEPAVLPSRYQSRQRTLDELGPPISRDVRYDESGLNDIHQDVVAVFMQQAKELDSEIRNREGLKRAIFSDREYREMAMSWTTSVAKMYKIRGIDKSKVDKYGVRFANLVEHYHAQYQDMMQHDSNAGTTKAQAQATGPGKHNTVNLVSSDVEMDHPLAAGFGDDFDDAFAGPSGANDGVALDDDEDLASDHDLDDDFDPTLDPTLDADNWHAELQRLQGQADERESERIQTEYTRSKKKSQTSRESWLRGRRRSRSSSSAGRGNYGSGYYNKRKTQARKKTPVSTRRRGAGPARGGAGAGAGRSNGIATMPH